MNDDFEPGQLVKWTIDGSEVVGSYRGRVDEHASKVKYLGETILVKTKKLTKVKNDGL